MTDRLPRAIFLLLEQVRTAIRRKHYSYRTEQTYVDWIRRFTRFHQNRHPRSLGPEEVTSFLSYLAVERHVAAATQNQALSAILFLYREVLHIDLDLPLGTVRAKKPKRLPTVLTREEVQKVIAFMTGLHQLVAEILYGSGLRVTECVRLRVKDLDFKYRLILVRDGKGEKDRVTMLPERLVQPLQIHLRRVKLIHKHDLSNGHGSVFLPFALDRKYPHASRE